jgi:hypothetical protein
MFFAEGFTFRNFLADVFTVFVFVVWFWLLITVLSDLLRRHDISGWVKAIWVMALIVFPYLGIFAYMITQARGMAERTSQQAQQAREELRRVAGFSAADEIEKLDRLKKSGSITDQEFTRLRETLIYESNIGDVEIKKQLIEVQPHQTTDDKLKHTDIATTALYNTIISVANVETQVLWQRYNVLLLGNSVILVALNSSGMESHPGLKVSLDLIGVLLCVLWWTLTWVAWDFWIPTARWQHGFAGPTSMIKLTSIT